MAMASGNLSVTTLEMTRDSVLIGLQEAALLLTFKSGAIYLFKSSKKNSYLKSPQQLPRKNLLLTVKAHHNRKVHLKMIKKRLRNQQKF